MRLRHFLVGRTFTVTEPREKCVERSEQQPRIGFGAPIGSSDYGCRPRETRRARLIVAIDEPHGVVRIAVWIGRRKSNRDIKCDPQETHVILSSNGPVRESSARVERRNFKP